MPCPSRAAAIPCPAGRPSRLHRRQGLRVPHSPDLLREQDLLADVADPPRDRSAHGFVPALLCGTTRRALEPRALLREAERGANHPPRGSRRIRRGRGSRARAATYRRGAPGRRPLPGGPLLASPGGQARCECIKRRFVVGREGLPRGAGRESGCAARRPDCPAGVPAAAAAMVRLTSDRVSHGTPCRHRPKIAALPPNRAGPPGLSQRGVRALPLVADIRRGLLVDRARKKNAGSKSHGLAGSRSEHRDYCRQVRDRVLTRRAAG